MGIFGKLFKGPEIDQAKSADSKQKMRRLFDSVVPDGGQYQLVAAYTEDAKRFNYGLVHGSKTTYGSLIVGWKEGADPTVVVVPTVPDLSGCGDPEICPRSAVKKAYQNKYPTDAFIYGLPTLQLASLTTDTRTLAAAHASAAELLEADPALTAPEHRALAGQVQRLFGRTTFN